MELHTLILVLKGITAGFIVSIPLGPIALVLIQRTMNKGVKSGVISGLGVATADTFYAAIGAFGVTFITNFLMTQQTELKILGGIILLLIGINMYKTDPLKKASSVSANPVVKSLGDFFSMFFLTITNPLIIFMYITAFTILGIGHAQGNTQDALLITIPIYLGATGWWILLTSGVKLFRHKIQIKKLFYINKITGIIVIVLAIGTGLSVFLSLDLLSFL